jgi:hypothetical protein
MLGNGRSYFRGLVNRVCAYILIVAFLGFSEDGISQTINLSDSLRHVLRNKAVPTAKIDTRNSFVTGRSAKVYGMKAGVSFGKILTIGIGYNWIGTDLPESIKENGMTFESQIKLRYVAPFLEYSFYKKGNWEVSVPVQLGFGKSFHQYKLGNEKFKTNVGRVVLYEPGMTFEYKIFNLIGVGAGLGYRIMLKNNKEIEQQFTSPVYVIRIRLIFDELFKQAKKLRE